MTFPRPLTSGNSHTLRLQSSRHFRPDRILSGRGKKELRIFYVRAAVFQMEGPFLTPKEKDFENHKHDRLTLDDFGRQALPWEALLRNSCC